MMGKLSMSRRLEVGEYKLLRKIKSPKQFDLFDVPNYVLSAILIQKTVEVVKRKARIYDPVKVAEKLRRGERIDLPPVMALRMALKGMGYSKNEISNMLRNPNEAGDFEDVVWDAITRDFVYSPIAVRFHQVKGKLGENLVEETLNSMGVEFKREDELETRKTPDFLLKEKISLFGYDVKWIESKFMFGDLKTHSHYWRRQYYPYIKEFGKGLIVYWPWHVGTPFSLSGEIDMNVHFEFGRLSRERFLKALERLLNDFEKRRKLEVKGDGRLLNFLKGLGFEVRVRQ